MLGSSNYIYSTSFINDGVYVTTNGGTSWFGSDTVNSPNRNDMRGDPGPTINKDGVFLFTHLTSATNFGGVTGMGANRSTDNGLTWGATVQVASDASADKNLATSDWSPSSPFYGNSYFAWTSFGTSPANGRASRTTDGGLTWSAPVIINTTPAGHNAQGHDCVTGPNGEVYVVWTAGVSTSPFTEDFVGLAKSTNGGVSFTATENAYDVNGSRSSSFNGWGIRTNGFPRIDVDKTTGPRRGWLYVVTSEMNLAPAGSDADIILHRSTDGGTTWSGGIRVNQDALNNAKVQFFPAISVDDAGAINIVYYDNRNFASVGDSCSVYMSRSLDGGANFTDVEVADHHFKPKLLPGINTMGDYIGVTSGNSKVWPFWMDDKTPGGNFQGWTTAVQTANYPLNAFNLQTPPAGTRITTLPNSPTVNTFTWDTSASTASYKWIFGNPTTTPRKITLATTGNSLNITSGQLDDILKNLGVAQGDSLVGQWDVWAFRNNVTNDSLKSTNGPRSLILIRGKPALTAFSLLNPPSNTTIVTSVFNNSTINFNWSRSGQGTAYRWQFASPNFSSPANIKFRIPSNNSGYDSNYSVVNSTLDQQLGSLGLNPGDSLAGQWKVVAYTSLDPANDSLSSTQTFNLTLRRQSKGDVLVCYDSTSVNGRTSRDSVTTQLTAMSITFDLFNKGGQTSTNSLSFRGYKKVVWLGEATSVMSAVQKDSIKAYLNSGTGTVKSKLLIYSEDIGYQFDRVGSTYYDSAFARGYLGFTFVLDRPASGANQGLVGAAINSNQPDSTVGTWPDVLDKSYSGRDYLYSFRTAPGSYNGIGKDAAVYRVATVGTDIRALRYTFDSPAGSLVRRRLQAAFNYLDNLTGVSNNNLSGIPDRFELSQNYPNPFNPVTKINFAIAKQGLVTIKVYDIVGREVTTLINEVRNPGYYSLDFNGLNFASGVYFYKLTSGTFSDIKRMVLVK
jgi:hypothetical protein